MEVTRVTGQRDGNSILTAIQQASRQTGANFDYLLATASRESGLNSTAKAASSSATGLFQFIENTWLATVKSEGERFGLGKYAGDIEQVGPNQFGVRDKQLRKEILNLRKDPQLAALMAGALTNSNARSLSAGLGRSPTDGELYIAHFLGAGDGERLIELAETRPNTPADRYFPRAARSNRSIFYQNGRPRSMSDVYQHLIRAHTQTVSRETREVVAAPSGLEQHAPARSVTPARTPAFGSPLFQSLYLWHLENSSAAQQNSSPSPIERLIAEAAPNSAVSTDMSGHRAQQGVVGPQAGQASSRPNGPASTMATNPLISNRPESLTPIADIVAQADGDSGAEVVRAAAESRNASLFSRPQPMGDTARTGAQQINKHYQQQMSLFRTSPAKHTREY